MLNYAEYAIGLEEFPDEIALCINISNCPCNCEGCCESYLAGNIGEELSEEVIDKLLVKYPGVSLVGFMGGDSDHKRIKELSDYIHSKGIKTGMYSGRDFLDMVLLDCLDYYKFGSYRPFKGDEETWKNQTAGPIVLPTSNQIMLKKENNFWINITERFRNKPISNWKNYIIQ